MATHLTAGTRRRYGVGALTAEELLAADAHLAGCAACRRRLFAEGDWGREFLGLRSALRAEAGPPRQPRRTAAHGGAT